MREEEAPSSADVISWEERRLCPDGGCVGVVGDDGACTTCGRVDPEAARRLDERAERAERANRPGDGDAASDDDDDDDGDGGEEVAAAASSPSAEQRAGEGSGAGEDGDEWQQRKLCEDGGCVGVVIDGRCATCNKAQ